MSNTNSENYDDFPSKNTGKHKNKYKKTNFEHGDISHVSIAADGFGRSKKNLRKDWETSGSEYEDFDEFFTK